MSATITPLLSRSSESGEGLEVQDRMASTAIVLNQVPTARDNFIAETAIKIDQLQASDRLLTRDFGELAVKVADLQEAVALEDRWYGFHQSEKRSREAKLDEVARCCRDLKARLDRMEARSGGDYHSYNSFEAVSRKLGEIERSTNERARRKDGRAWLVSGLLGPAPFVSTRPS
jgi:hypothetical protein